MPVLRHQREAGWAARESAPEDLDWTENLKLRRWINSILIVAIVAATFHS
ncbi:hypothetical protein [Methylorubrum zatmanii]|uniref:Light-harvesting protein n=1 Tax=Methylorubrum zatmanii TaxID=29429 RepID=A0ABW1WQK6_9HYPH|nr:hypothetical protein [Methylorubrum zatmanii]